MKNLRAALESGDMIASKNGLLSSEEEMQDAGIDMVTDVSNQFEESVPSTISMESILRHKPYGDVVLRKSYPVVSMEGLSDGAFYLIGVVISSIVLLIVRFSKWRSSSSSFGGGGGGSSGRSDASHRATIESMRRYTETLRKQTEKINKFNEELRRKKPGFTPPQSTDEKDLNAPPPPKEHVGNMDDVIDVAYREVKSHDKQRFIDLGDPYIQDFVEKSEHYEAVFDLHIPLQAVTIEIKLIHDTLIGAASHNLVKDLEEGIIRDVYRTSPLDKILRHGRRNLDLTQIAQILKETLDEQRQVTKAPHREYVVLLERLTQNYAELDFEAFHERFDTFAKEIEEISGSLERIKESIKGKKDGAAKEATKVFLNWLRDVGRYIAAAMVIMKHVTDYEKNSRTATMAFQRMGQHAIDAMYKGLEPHEKSEMKDVYEDTRDATKEVLKIGHSK